MVSGWSMGLSPRVRGNHVEGRHGVRGQGLGIERASFLGLSPRVRGNRLMPYGVARATGSIPACAGEPCEPCHVSTKNKVYPRVCGGTRRTSSDAICAVRLSPRVRGNRSLCAGVQTRNRSIPACAGEPPMTTSQPFLNAVYPRVCGGTILRSPSAILVSGLSPRVRGNHWLLPEQLHRAGSIPACAGEPIPAGRGGTYREVYPRVCGGTSVSVGAHSPAEGLSPRVRGNLHLGFLECLEEGSIPACAGEPTVQVLALINQGVYPRVCGGTLEALPRTRTTEGLSPRVRGNRWGRWG